MNACVNETADFVWHSCTVCNVLQLKPGEADDLPVSNAPAAAHHPLLLGTELCFLSGWLSIDGISGACPLEGHSEAQLPV